MTLRPSWSQAVDGFAGYLRAANRSPETIRLRTYWVGRFASECWESDCGRDAQSCGDPFQVRLDDLLRFMANESWSAETRKSARSSLVAFYRWAVDTDRITERADPTRRLPKVTPARALPRPAPDNVLRDALWQATDRDRLILMLAGYGGLRRAEIAQVHTVDFNWSTGLLLVHGKGGHDRAVPIHPDLTYAVRAEIARRQIGQHGSGYRFDSQIRPDGYLFPGKHGHVTPDTIGRVLDRLLAGKWTGHTLRHRFASAAYAADRDLRAVQELLGHSKPETTARYVQTPPDAMRAAVLAVGLDAA
ncbi:tyrosine-type recombinase/integrase [Kribbella sp. NBC_00889]|uniref:tyrosine-type recombinase/integrase n=1 Tax=Kribbella sp. NBC_00889 TaxID=2975974 RepID=UPI003869ED1F|nr:site-specific integrase [Kribbella sp. NBC_00889]